MIGALIDQKTM